MPRYPYATTNLSSAGDAPADGYALRPHHLSRLQAEFTLLVGALGLGVNGAFTTLKDRLASMLNDDGTYLREVLCEDDPSGNSFPTLRYLDVQATQITVNPDALVTPRSDAFVPLAYCLWETTPAMFWTVQVTNAAGFDDASAIVQINNLSEVGANFEVRKYDGTIGASAARNVQLGWMAMSRRLRIWEDDVAWGLPPVRNGS